MHRHAWVGLGLPVAVAIGLVFLATGRARLPEASPVLAAGDQGPDAGAAAAEDAVPAAADDGGEVHRTEVVVEEDAASVERAFLERARRGSSFEVVTAEILRVGPCLPTLSGDHRQVKLRLLRELHDLSWFHVIDVNHSAQWTLRTHGCATSADLLARGQVREVVLARRFGRGRWLVLAGPPLERPARLTALGQVPGSLRDSVGMPGCSVFKGRVRSVVQPRTPTWLRSDAGMEGVQLEIEVLEIAQAATRLATGDVAKFAYIRLPGLPADAGSPHLDAFRVGTTWWVAADGALRWIQAAVQRS